jgi:hypothetical protein
VLSISEASVKKSTENEIKIPSPILTTEYPSTTTSRRKALNKLKHHSFKLKYKNP